MRQHASPSDSPSGVSVLSLILASLDQDKADDIVTIDLEGKTSIADAMVVASGRSQRHVGAIADHLEHALKDVLKDKGLAAPRVEGLPHCDWVLIDAGDVIVHVFRPEVRTFYNLEKLWSADRAPESGTPDSRAAGAH